MMSTWTTTPRTTRHARFAVGSWAAATATRNHWRMTSLWDNFASSALLLLQCGPPLWLPWPVQSPSLRWRQGLVRPLPLFLHCRPRSARCGLPAGGVPRRWPLLTGHRRRRRRPQSARCGPPAAREPHPWPLLIGPNCRLTPCIYGGHRRPLGQPQLARRRPPSALLLTPLP